jgi:hypothetical protein
MAKSNAERQREYRHRALKDPDGTILTRLQVMISAHADASLNRIVAKTGMTKREAVERALVELAGSLRCNE